MQEPQHISEIIERIMPHIELLFLESQITEKFDPELSLKIDQAIINDENA